MARNSTFVLLLSLYFRPMGVLGFLPSWMPGVVLSSAPELETYARGQTDTLLDVRLSIGLTANHLFVIDGFQFQLCDEPLASGEHVVLLPGAHGPRPHLSSGAHEVRTLEDGSYVNMEGAQNVEFRDGAWEMIWRDDSPAGLVICGFSLDGDARRNDLFLEKGQVYLTWPVWSKNALVDRWDRKAKAEAEYEEFQAERDRELEKMGSAPNILQKALHFRNAAAATEKMDYTGLHNLMDVPLAEDVLEIGEGLQVVRTGTVWKKNGSFSGIFRANRQSLLGSATLQFQSN